MLEKALKRIRRKARIRAKISGTSKRPRLSVFRSNSNIYVQLIDDEAGKTLYGSSDLKMKKEWTKTEMASKLGEEVATKIKELKVKEIVFDRGWFAYHGRVKALAESIRSNSIKF